MKRTAEREDTMRFNGKTTAALVAAALVAVGCSKSDDTRAQSQDSARAINISMTDKSTGLLPAGPVEPPKITGPASFGDGEAAYQAGNFGEAARVFEQYTGEKPDNAWGHYMLGLSAWKAGDSAKAEMAFEKALALDPDHKKSLVNLSRVLIEQSRFEDALVKLTRAGELESTSAEVQRLLGRTFHGQGKPDEAIAAYRRAIELDDMDVWSMNNLGFLYLEQGRPQEAILPLSRAVELKKDVATFHNNLGMALEHTGRYTAAAAEYNSALEADPGHEKAKLNLARVQAVKVIVEEPFDLEATAKRFVDETEVPAAVQ
jgi:Flp pilus assembly protein TadD